jgi:hypothetical protein
MSMPLGVSGEGATEARGTAVSCEIPPKQPSNILKKFNLEVWKLETPRKGLIFSTLGSVQLLVRKVSSVVN